MRETEAQIGNSGLGWRRPMRSRLVAIFAVAVGLLIASVPLAAHHGSAAFDAEKRVTLKGTVTEWFWANPHCLLEFDVKEDNGQVVHWVGEASNPPDMVNHGWSKQSLKPGDQVTVTVEPVRNGKPLGRVMQVVLPDGKTLNGGFGSMPLPAGTQGGGSAGAAPGSGYSKQ
jgi:hypothetical protein